MKTYPTLPEFHPQTKLSNLANGASFTVADAQAGVFIGGATGSGKTSGPGQTIAKIYAAAGMGGVVLCSKKEECSQWLKWGRAAGRSDDIIVVDAAGSWRFNFLDYEASRPAEGGGLTINIVSILDEVGGAIAGGAGKTEGSQGENKFWEDGLHHMNTNLVELPILAGLQVSLPLLRSILNSAPQSLEQVADPQWQDTSTCALTLREADKATADADASVRADFDECQNYWLQEYPALSEKTRSIISLMFSMLVRPLLTRPLRKIFCTDTNITPEATFDGKIIIVDLPVQEFRLAGRIANLVWKYNFQLAVLRRMQPESGFLRPVFLWADEAQMFITKFDAEYQAVARSAAGCTVYLTQNRESFRRVLGNNDAVDSLLGNLQTKFFCQNTGETNTWAAMLLGERWVRVTSSNVGRSRNDTLQPLNPGSHSFGISRSEQRRYFVEPSVFTTLKRGGPQNNFLVEAIVYKGGHEFLTGQNGKEELLPYALLTFDQR